jgi:hypothetical protein
MHLFSPANPLTLIQSGLTWYIGRAGLCTQLSPIPVGFGTPSQNPGQYSGGPSPGGPNWGASGSGPYTPPFPPFPHGFVKFSLTTFNVTAELSGAYGNGYVAPAPIPPDASAVGVLNSGGGVNGCILGAFTNWGNVGSFPEYLVLAALKSSFATNPFPALATGMFTKLTLLDELGDTVTLPSASVTSYTAISNTTYWGQQWLWNIHNNGWVDGDSYTVTVS